MPKYHQLRGGTHHNKFESQSLKTICVGKCPKSDSLLFYHPPSKTLISDADGHCFNNFSLSGPQFGLKYDGSYSITCKSAQPIHQQPQHELNETKFVKIGNQYKEANILHVPLDPEDNIYTVQMRVSGEIQEVQADKLFDTNSLLPTSDSNQPVNHLYPWLKHDSQVTLFLSNHWSSCPKQGYLSKDENEWFIIPGRNKKSKPLHLPNFEEVAELMVHNRKLFQGWKKAESFINAHCS